MDMKLLFLTDLQYVIHYSLYQVSILFLIFGVVCHPGESGQEEQEAKKGGGEDLRSHDYLGNGFVQLGSMADLVPDAQIDRVVL